MKLFVTGAYGQVGSELKKQATRLGWNVCAVDRDGLDITDAAAVRGALKAFLPDVAVNAAAYTAVDKAESDVDEVFVVNRDGPKNLAAVCADLDVPFVHYSTDYVFDGSKVGAYIESDPVAPLGVYGESKLAGEAAVRAACNKYLILRTSWVFSSHGNNFVKTMLRLAGEREELGVVADQVGKPTSAAEIARVTLALLSSGNGSWGTYNLAQPDVTSWHGFASEIFKIAKVEGELLKLNNLRAITTSEYPTPAKRPANSELDCKKLESTFGISLRPWQDSLKEVIRELKYG